MFKFDRWKKSSPNLYTDFLDFVSGSAKNDQLPPKELLHRIESDVSTQRGMAPSFTNREVVESKCEEQS